MQELAENPTAAFLPWVLFWVIAGSPSTWEFGAIAAFIAAGVLLFPRIARRPMKMLDLATVAVFGVVAVLGAMVGPHDNNWVDRWSTTLSSGVLALLVLLSLPSLPFAGQDARESTPREASGVTAFRRTNRVLTLVWGGVFAATAMLGAIAADKPSTSDWTNWVLPIALIVAAVRFTTWYPERVRLARTRRPDDWGN